jgi:hypothetical protein
MNNEKWDKCYELAKKYYEENRNLLISDRYVTIDNIKLGRWIGTQRGNYKNNKLSKEKIELLEKIGMVWDPTETQWNECYELAKEYYKKNKNLLITHDYIINNIKLGRWIGTQRGNYKKNKLSKDKIELLEKIGMVWDQLDTQWNECYELAKEYYKENGDLLILYNYIARDKINLGTWIQTQRNSYKNGILTKEKIELLEKIGMVWNPLDTQWNEYYELAKEYYNKNGNLLISTEYTTNEGIHLGNWIHSQRRGYSEHKLSKEKIKQLEKIGMVWSPLDTQWNNYYNLAKEYYRLNNTLLIPYNYITEDGLNLGSWIGNQRSAYSKNKLSKKKIELLENIGMVWNTIDTQWEDKYYFAKKYYKENGNLLIPYDYTVDDKINLGSWINTQRYAYKEKRLSKERIELLEKIGMVWSPYDLMWYECYNLAKEYYEKNRNLLIPATYVSEDGKQLGLWLSRQRGLFKEQNLTKDRIQLLEKIGMVWNPFDTQWKEYYDLAKEYYNKNGNLLIPLDYILNNDIYLGNWIGTQRRNYKDKKLSKEKIKQLEKIGMIWDPFDAQWKEYYDSLVEYYNINGDSLVPIRYITEDGKQLGYWIQNQRRNYKDKKLSKGRIKLLEKISMVWDPASMTWNQTYFVAKEYYKENGNLNIPNNYFYKNVNIGSWILTQRNNYKEKILTDSQIDMLNEIGMEWNSIRSRDYIWNHNYDIVLDFYKKYKHIYIPTNYIAKDGTNIGMWLFEQKTKYKNNKLSEDRKNKLDLLDESWLEPTNTKSSFPEYAVLYYIKKIFQNATKLQTKEISEIDIYIPELKVGIEYDGPTHIKSVEKDVKKSNICKKLGIELIRIRDAKCPIINDQSYKIILNNDSFEALENGIIELLAYLNITNFDINIKRDYFEISDNYIKSIDLNWYSMYEKLEEYKKEYGNINVPINYTTSDGSMLGHWLSNIRQSVRNPNLQNVRVNSNKIDLLNKLGMDWNPLDTQWEKIYNIAGNYYKERGNLLIPDKYVTTDNIKLGKWIGTQRGNYKKNKLSKEKIELLEKIGMVWEVRKKH